MADPVDRGPISCAQCGRQSEYKVKNPPWVGHWESTPLYNEGWHARRNAVEGNEPWDQWYCSECWRG